jgi:hypothetical protein
VSPSEEELARGGPPAEHLREELKKQFGEVPPESPSEPDEHDEHEHEDDEHDHKE